MEKSNQTGNSLLAVDVGEVHTRAVLPSALDGSGIDMFVGSISAGPPLRVIAVGLLDDISLASAKRLVSTTYAQVVETLGLNDRKKPEERLDIILSCRPDLIIIAGGTENGATNSVIRLVESVRLACSLMPKEQRPEVLYTGNQALGRRGSFSKRWKISWVR